MIYRFNHIELDCETFQLTRDQQPESIEPQVFDLVVYLIERRDRVVTRNELLDNLWSGKVVSDATLSNHIKMARAALGDDGEQQQTIKTIRGRGYQFVAEIKPSQLGAQTEDASPVKNARSHIAIFWFGLVSI